MCKQHLLKCSRVTTGLFVIILIGFSLPVLAESPNIPCPTGTELVAKYEWTSGGYVFEKPDGNADLVSINSDANASGGGWSALTLISHVILKGSTGTHTYEQGSMSGQFSKFDLPQNGGGQIPDISNIQFCMGDIGTTNAEECDFIYGVHDEKLNDSQFLTIDPAYGFVIDPLGFQYDDYDIEAVDIDYGNNELYVASGDDTTRPGHLYKVDMISGDLTEVGATGFAEVDGISFSPDDTLWGWAQDAGLFTVSRGVDGELDLATVNLVLPMPGEYEDLSWNISGTILYVVQNNHGNYPHPYVYTDDLATYHPDPESDANVPHLLWAYEVAGGSLQPVCSEVIDSLTGGREIEAIEAITDNTLIFGYHKSQGQPIIAKLNLVPCQATILKELVAEYVYDIPSNQFYNDIEGLGICPNDPPDFPPTGCPDANTDWMYVKDAFDDASGLDSLEVYGMAIKQTEDTVVVAINANMGPEGITEQDNPKMPDKVKDGHIGFSDFVFDFDGQKYAVHFSPGNDSAVTELGLYTDITLMDVGKENVGWRNLDIYTRKNPTASLGDLPLEPPPVGYFEWTQQFSIPMSIESGVKVAGDNFAQLTEADLSAMGLDFATGLGTNANDLGPFTFGFSFTKAEGMTGEFIGYFFTECLNEGLAITRELPSCPDN